MDAIGIVEVLNNKIKEYTDKGHFILHKEIECNSFSKAYKEYRWTLWYIYNRSKHKVTTLSNTGRVVTDNEEANMISFMEAYLLSYIFDLLQDTNTLKLMSNGEFKGI